MNFLVLGLILALFLIALGAAVALDVLYIVAVVILIVAVAFYAIDGRR